MFEVKDICCQRDERILFNKLSFILNPSECVFIRGANGCGKTTLLRALCGLFPIEAGDVFWQQQLLPKNRYAFQSDLLYIGHQSGVKANLTVIENLKSLCGFAKRFTQDKLQAALTKIGLRGYDHVLAQHLSAGQQRRVALARLLLANEKLWILDEPFTALDYKGVALIAETIRQHVSNNGMAIVTSHQPLELNNVSIKQVNLDKQ